MTYIYKVFRVGKSESEGRAILTRPRVFQQKLKVTYFYDVFRILLFGVQEALEKGGVGGVSPPLEQVISQP